MTNAYNVQSTPPARKKWTKRKVAVAAAIGGVLVVPAAAYAAVNIFGFGQINADAAATENLTVQQNSVALTKKLVPGETVGAKAIVTNTNDFPVKVTGVLVKESTLTVTPTAGCAESVHVVSTGTATWPGSAGGNAFKQAIAEPVTIPAGQAVWITVPAAVKQDANASVLCGVKADFAVVGQVGS